MIGIPRSMLATMGVTLRKPVTRQYPGPMRDLPLAARVKAGLLLLYAPLWLLLRGLPQRGKPQADEE